MNENSFTVREVAKKFRVTPYTVRRWLNIGLLTGERSTPDPNRSQWIIPESAVEKLRTERRENGKRNVHKMNRAEGAR